jgi:PAS domain S-box-containing protein
MVVKVKERGQRKRTAPAARGEIRQPVSRNRKKGFNLTILNGISNLITQSVSIHQVISRAADIIKEALAVDTVLIFLLNNKKPGEFLLEVSKGLPEEFLKETGPAKISEGFREVNEKVARTGKALEMAVATDSVLPGAGEKKSRLIVPMLSWGNVVGTFYIARKAPGGFHKDEVTLLTCVGNNIGVALGSAYLHHEMKQALTQLQQSEERYRALFEGAYDAIWVHDMDGCMLAANKACEKLTGYSVEELMKKNICHIMPESSQICLYEVERKLEQNEVVDRRCEGEVVKKSGDKAIIQVATSLIMSDNQPIGFQHCGRDVTEERRLQDNIHYYLQQVTRAQEEERKRIARELHDEILQRLIAISRQLEKITSSDALWEESLPTVRDFKKQVEVAVQEVRRFSRDLRPSILDDLGLLAALDLLADDLERQGIATSFKVVGESRRLMPEAEVMLFRIAQEAAANIRRHAHASVAELKIEFIDSKVKLTVQDNGTGFNVPQNAGDLASSGKLGLVGMYERTKLLGGSFTMGSRPGKGTVVTVEVPVKALLAHTSPP